MVKYANPKTKKEVIQAYEYLKERYKKLGKSAFSEKYGKVFPKIKSLYDKFNSKNKEGKKDELYWIDADRYDMGDKANKQFANDVSKIAKELYATYRKYKNHVSLLHVKIVGNWNDLAKIYKKWYDNEIDINDDFFKNEVMNKFNKKDTKDDNKTITKKIPNSDFGAVLFGKDKYRPSLDDMKNKKELPPF